MCCCLVRNMVENILTSRWKCLVLTPQKWLKMFQSLVKTLPVLLPRTCLMDLAHTNTNYKNYSCCLTAWSFSLTLLLSVLSVATASSGRVEETALLFLSFTQQDTRKAPSVSKYKLLLVFGGKKARPHYAIIPVDSTQIPVRSRGSVAPLGLVVHNSHNMEIVSWESTELKEKEHGCVHYCFIVIIVFITRNAVWSIKQRCSLPPGEERASDTRQEKKVVPRSTTQLHRKIAKSKKFL